MAVLITAMLPTGDNGFTSDEVDPGLRLMFHHTLPNRVGLDYDAAVLRSGGDPEFFYTLTPSFVLSDRLGVFVDQFGSIDKDSGRYGLDAGLTFLVRDNLQLDGCFGIGLNDDATDWFAGAGISIRLPR